MKQSRELPPNWTELQEAFGVEWGQVCVTYGDTVYSSKELPDDILAHEEVHSRRQGNDPAAWWKRYMADPDFRKQEEILGYKAQMKYIKSMTKDRNRLFNAKDNIARSMSGTIYGKCMNYHEAMACLK